MSIDDIAHGEDGGGAPNLTVCIEKAIFSAEDIGPRSTFLARNWSRTPFFSTLTLTGLDNEVEHLTSGIHHMVGHDESGIGVIVKARRSRFAGFE